MISVRECYKCQKCFSTNTKTDCHSMLLLNATKDNNNSLQSLIDDHMKTDSIDGKNVKIVYQNQIELIFMDEQKSLRS